MKKLGKKMNFLHNETIAAYACTPCVCGCIPSKGDESSDTSGDSSGEGK